MKISARERARRKWTAAKAWSLERMTPEEIMRTATATGTVPHFDVEGVEQLGDGRVRATLSVVFKPIDLAEVTRECLAELVALLERPVGSGEGRDDVQPDGPARDDAPRDGK